MDQKVAGCKTVTFNTRNFGLNVYYQYNNGQQCQHKPQGSQEFSDNIFIYNLQGLHSAF